MESKLDRAGIGKETCYLIRRDWLTRISAVLQSNAPIEAGGAIWPLQLDGMSQALTPLERLIFRSMTLDFAVASLPEWLRFIVRSRCNEVTNYVENNGAEAPDEHALVAIRAREIIDKEYATRLTIAQLAKRLSTQRRYHRNSVAQAFVATFGVSIADHLFIVRMNKALPLLLRDRDKIEVVARSAGFGSRSTFSTRLKKLTGYSPVELRDRMQTKANKDSDVQTRT